MALLRRHYCTLNMFFVILHFKGDIFALTMYAGSSHIIQFTQSCRQKVFCIELQKIGLESRRNEHFNPNLVGILKTVCGPKEMKEPINEWKPVAFTNFNSRPLGMFYIYYTICWAMIVLAHFPIILGLKNTSLYNKEKAINIKALINIEVED